ncbi:4-hydroxythreonine-4-phosphate dehydrogenase PdxA [Methylovirgula sp. 4M-Z18]|uniref:4-hydroxythreonine-4-phosphate dehydrogenase PdxA n=1 Tax=Methylovirgula sp. 4M-Z18 TaxID=2293567 RepID=UPI000E2F5974|nr:4-hydroxythreonine-4-phosphate dehydrogenase PdxA [Methylovirgula sp. 4M-Z18]RFB76735.1 4-hydroxythreonine-4-phosphate dehydrogenase PdxA [Methylovirgula sp. 4M-Z18]
MNQSLPTIALAIGDPAGISPELTAKVIALPEVRKAARFVLFGDKRVLDAGARVAGIDPDVAVASTVEEALRSPYDKPILVDLANCDPATVRVGEVSRQGGAAALQNFRTAIDLARAGAVDAICFTPFNKAAMRLAHPTYADEIVFLDEILGTRGTASEFNILDNVWNARVTSHVPLKGVAELITKAAILQSIERTHGSMVRAGFTAPRIAVAALNPHAGDGGNFGREEIDVIGPAVEEAKAKGFAVEGPFPSDTVFLRAKSGAFDAVLTMYHDQGQIAMKLMGFDVGVTLLGGYPVPIATPAHGTAYEIAGKGIANVGATRQALLLAARMGRREAGSRFEPSGAEIRPPQTRAKQGV